MGYTLLKELYYKDSQAYNNLYKERFESQYTHHIDFKIGDSPAFFVVTPEIQDGLWLFGLWGHQYPQLSQILRHRNL